MPDSIQIIRRNAEVNRWHSRCLIGSILLYVGCMFVVPYNAGDIPSLRSGGWAELLGGWMGMLYGYYAWLANPLLFTAWMFAAHQVRAAAMAAATIAMLFALSFVLHDEIPINEAPDYATIHLNAAGYWLWLASILLALVDGVLLTPNVKEHRQ